MANTYFRFKQFIIHQERCAMKVCTDACLFGSWVASHSSHLTSVLDVGSGTGLLMMMLAQQLDANIDGIEINTDCYSQLSENISQNEWKERFQIFNSDARTFDFGKKYDLIISNPPFYENDLPSDSEAEQLAKHSISFGFRDLINLSLKFLNNSGKLAVLLPYHRYDSFKSMAVQNGFYLSRATFVRQTLKHDYFRAMLLLQQDPCNMITEEISIRGKNEYSEAFIEMMKDYYLSL